MSKPREHRDFKAAVGERAATPIRVSYRICTLTLGCLVMTLLGLARSQAAASDAPKAPATGAAGSAEIVEMRYEQGLLDARIENATLGHVLAALAAETGIQVHCQDATIAAQRVWETVQRAPLAQGVRKLLHGFSYAHYTSADGPTVRVLNASTGSAEASKPQPVPIKKPVIAAPDPSQPNELAPLSQAPESDEELLERLNGVLASDRAHLHADALDQLGDLGNQRATEALTQAALGKTAAATESRVYAVGALARNASSSEASDSGSVDALTRLAEDSNDAVGAAARQALKDLRKAESSRPHVPGMPDA